MKITESLFHYMHTVKAALPFVHKFQTILSSARRIQTKVATRGSFFEGNSPPLWCCALPSEAGPVFLHTIDKIFAFAIISVPETTNVALDRVWSVKYHWQPRSILAWNGLLIYNILLASFPGFQQFKLIFYFLEALILSFGLLCKWFLHKEYQNHKLVLDGPEENSVPSLKQSRQQLLKKVNPSVLADNYKMIRGLSDLSKIEEKILANQGSTRALWQQFLQRPTPNMLLSFSMFCTLRKIFKVYTEAYAGLVPTLKNNITVSELIQRVAIDSDLWKKNESSNTQALYNAFLGRHDSTKRWLIVFLEALKVQYPSVNQTLAPTQKNIDDALRTVFNKIIEYTSLFYEKEDVREYELRIQLLRDRHLLLQWMQQHTTR